MELSCWLCWDPDLVDWDWAWDWALAPRGGFFLLSGNEVDSCWVLEGLEGMLGWGGLGGGVDGEADLAEGP